MKLFRYLIPAALLLTLAGCDFSKEQLDPALGKAVLSKDNVVTFDAIKAAAQTIEVYSDGAWTAEVSDDWVHVDPLFGLRNQVVTITVEDNLDENGEKDNPRNATIKFVAGSKNADQCMTVTIKQKGDNYKGVKEMTISEVSALADETFSKIKAGTVLAVADSNRLFILSDGEGTIQAVGAIKDAKIGDKYYMAGSKVSRNGLPAFMIDEFDLLGTETPSYPTAKDITSTVDSYTATTYEYVSIEGELAKSIYSSFGDIHVTGATLRPILVGANANLKKLNAHKVKMTGFYAGSLYSTPSFILATADDQGAGTSPYPATFAVGSAEPLNYTNASWSGLSMFEAYTGTGFIHYVPALDKNGVPVKNDNNKYLLDINANNPRVTGAWTGDYWLFEVPDTVKAGTKVNIKFQTRVSATNPKYWMLEYFDGGKWKIAGKVKTSTDTGASLDYTHMMAPDGSTNINVEEEISFNKNNSECLIRFRCLTSFQANGAATLTARNGGTARLAVTDAASKDWWPTITLVKEGDGTEIPDKDPIIADVKVSETLLTFEGTGGEQVIKVSSDNDFTVESDEEWLSFDPAEGKKGSDVNVTVKCAATELSTLRKGLIKVISEDTTVEINVVQSAAGQELDPLLSISKSAANISSDAQPLKIRVQSNVEYTVDIDQAWVSQAPATKSMVDVEDILFNVEENTETTARTAHVTFTAGELQSILTINQKAASKLEVIFSDDFSWLKPFIDAFNADNTSKPISDYVGGSYSSLDDRVNKLHQAPNVYTDAHFGTAFAEAVAAHGYEDVNPGAKVIYPQDAYLKFGKNNNSGGLLVSPFKSLANSADVNFNFDWSVHMTGSFVVDVVDMVLSVEGEGTFENGTKEIDLGQTGMKDNADPFWKSESVLIKGVNKDTKIKMLSKQGRASLTTSGQHRWYVDNIKVEKVSEVLWNDDFSWLSSLISEYNTANPTNPIGDFVTGTFAHKGLQSAANAPNAYTAEPFKSKFPAALAAAGYTDLNPGAKVIYPQDCYLKLGKTSAHTGLRFAPFASLASESNAEVSLKWCRHFQGTSETAAHTVDPVTLKIYIEGAGTFEKTGTKESEDFTTTQGEGEAFWTEAKAKILGADSTTKITIISAEGKASFTTSGAHRIHIDDIKVVTL